MHSDCPACAAGRLYGKQFRPSTRKTEGKEKPARSRDKATTRAKNNNQTSICFRRNRVIHFTPGATNHASRVTTRTKPAPVLWLGPGKARRRRNEIKEVKKKNKHTHKQLAELRISFFSNFDEVSWTNIRAGPFLEAKIGYDSLHQSSLPFSSGVG